MGLNVCRNKMMLGKCGESHAENVFFKHCCHWKWLVIIDALTLFPTDALIILILSNMQQFTQNVLHVQCLFSLKCLLHQTFLWYDKSSKICKSTALMIMWDVRCVRNAQYIIWYLYVYSLKMYESINRVSDDSFTISRTSYGCHNISIHQSFTDILSRQRFSRYICLTHTVLLLDSVNVTTVSTTCTAVKSSVSLRSFYSWAACCRTLQYHL